MLSGIDAAPQGEPHIEVKFEIDVNGVLLVKASDKGTGREQSITIADSSNLTRDEVEDILLTAEEFAKDDSEKRQNIELSTITERNCYRIEVLLNSLKSMNLGMFDIIQIEMLRFRKNLYQENFKNIEFNIIKLEIILLKIADYLYVLEQQKIKN